MNEQRRFDEDDAMIGPAQVPEAAVPPQPQEAPPRAEPAPPAPVRRSVSGRLLTALLLLLAGAAAALIGGPRIAPMLPAPVAAWLAPAGQAGAAAIREELATELDALRSELGIVRGSAESAREQAAAALAAAEGAVEAAAAGPAEPDGETPARLEGLESRIGALQGEVEDAIGQRDSALRTIRAEIAALDRRVAEAPAFTAPADLEDLRARLAALEASLANDVSVRERALAEAEQARRAATLTTILSDIDRAMAFGRPFTAPLAALREATDVAVPPALAEAAETGAPTREALANDFAQAAHRAVTEALAAGAEGESGVGEVLARVQARFTGIPTEPVEGDTVPAILSRARHSAENGDLEAALASIATLPQSAQGALGDWVAGARLRAGADAALADLRAEIGRGY